MVTAPVAPLVPTVLEVLDRHLPAVIGSHRNMNELGTATATEVLATRVSFCGSSSQLKLPGLSLVLGSTNRLDRMHQ